MKVYHSNLCSNEDKDNKALTDGRPADQEDEGDNDFQRLLNCTKAELEKEDDARAKATEAGTDAGAKQQDGKAKREGANTTTQKAGGEDASATLPTDTWLRRTTTRRCPPTGRISATPSTLSGVPPHLPPPQRRYGRTTRLPPPPCLPR